MTHSQWYIGAPNGVVLCITDARNGRLSGRLYHSYSARPQFFDSVDRMISLMEQLYDMLHFPYPGNSERSFGPAELVKKVLTKEREKIMDDDSLLRNHGDIGTFIVRVQHRQNSSWQGRITWMEQDKTINFRSVWEMVKLIESAVNTVAPDEEAETEASWFEEP